LVLESTYGDRDHPEGDPKDQLAEIIRRTAARGGSVLIPAFAVGRTQVLLYLLRELQIEDRLPIDIPIHVDSPMAIHATRVLMDHPEAQNLDMRARGATGRDPLGLRNVHLDIRVEDSRALDSLTFPSIIISASGMAVSGRVLHHLVSRLPDHRNTVVLVGHQAVGTRGRALQERAKSIKIHGGQVPVRARVETLEGLSAHADRGQLLAWLRAAKQRPRTVHLVHGELEATKALADRIRSELGLEVHVPVYLEKVEI
jgi:metallo-beta-lactamase family protein